ncbi:MAG: hypothetical protein ACYC2H_03055 [Thermoplasmatota archaeon]
MRFVFLVALLAVLAGCASPPPPSHDSAPVSDDVPRHQAWYDATVVPTPEGAWAAYRWSLPADTFISTNGTEPGIVIDLVPDWNATSGSVDAWALLFFVEREGNAAFAGGYVASDRFEQTVNDPLGVTAEPASMRPINLFVGYGNIVSLIATGRTAHGLYGHSLGPTAGETVYVVLGAKGPGAGPFQVAFRTSEGNPNYDAEVLDTSTEVESAIPLTATGAASGLALDYYARRTLVGLKFETWTAGIGHTDVANPVLFYQDNVNLEELQWQGGDVSAGWGVLGAYASSIGLTSVRGTMAMLNDTSEIDGLGGVDPSGCAGGGTCRLAPEWGRFAEGYGAGPRFTNLTVANVGAYVENLYFYAVGIDAPIESLLGLPPAGRGEATFSSPPRTESLPPPPS